MTEIQLLNLAFAAYGGSTNPIPAGFRRVADTSTRKFTIDDKVSGFYLTTFQNTTTNEYVVSFRGTENFADWANNANRGWPQFKSNLTAIRELLDHLTTVSSSAKVQLTGHSLGGGLAQFAAYDFASRNRNAGSKIALTTWNSMGGAWGLVANALSTYKTGFNKELLQMSRVNTTHFYRFDDLVPKLGAQHLLGSSGVGSIVRLGEEFKNTFLNITEAHGKVGLQAALNQANFSRSFDAPTYLDVTEAAQAVTGAVASGLLNINQNNLLTGIAGLIFGVRPLVEKLGGDEKILQEALVGAGTVLREGLTHFAKANVDLAAINERISLPFIENLVNGIDAFLEEVQTTLDAIAVNSDIPVLGKSLQNAVNNAEPGLRQILAIRDAVKGVLEGARAAIDNNNYRTGDLFVDLNLAMASKGINAEGINVKVENNELLLSLNLGGSKTFQAGIDSKLGLGNLLNLQSSGVLSVNAGVDMNLQFGVDRQGFYVDTRSTNGKELKLELGAALNGVQANARVGFLDFKVKDKTAQGNDAAATYSFDIKDNDGKLRRSEITSKAFEIEHKLTGNVDLNLGLTGKAISILPSISTDLNVKWDLEQNSPSIEFSDAKLDLDSFFNGFAKGILGNVRTVTDKIKPVTQVLLKEIALLKEIKAPDTLLKIAETAGLIKPETRQAIEAVAQFVNLVGSVPNDAKGVFINLGKIRLNPDFNPTLQKLSEAGTLVIETPSSISSQQRIAADFIKSYSNFTGGGFSIPLLDNPKTAFSLLLGKPVDLFKYEMPTLEIGLDFSKIYPILGPIVVELAGELSAYARLAFGFDTTGLQKFADSNKLNDILDGFYVNDLDKDGNDINEVGLKGALEISANLEALLASLSAGGGIYADVGLDLRDLDKDGKVRWSEVISPQGGFRFNGSLSAGAFAEAILLGKSLRWDSPRVTLLAFGNENNDASKIKPATISGSNLLLNTGSRFALSGLQASSQEVSIEIKRLSGNSKSETVRVTLYSFAKDYTFGMSILGNGSQSLGGGSNGADSLRVDASVTRGVTFDARGGNDELRGGAGDDSLTGGAGNDLLAGGAGMNTLLGGEGSDIFLPSGRDSVDGGAGFDVVSYREAKGAVTINLATRIHAGAANGSSFQKIEQFEGSRFADRMTAGNSGTVLIGLGGKDTLTGGRGGDALDGGLGTDFLDGKEGIDSAWYDTSTAKVTINLLRGRGRGGHAEGDVLKKYRESDRLQL